MANRIRFMGFMVDQHVDGRPAEPAPASAKRADTPRNGPSKRTPGELVFGSEPQTLEELRAELESAA